MNINILKNIFSWVAILLLITACGLISISAFNLPLGIKLHTVMSGSMEPNIPVGSIIISQKGNYKTGDIIVYESGRSSITHRIVDIKKEGEDIFFLTKGDANNANDGKLVAKSSILGKVLFTIPFLGYLSAFAKTLPGLIILMIVPATIIIYGEIINIKRGIVEEISQKHSRKDKWQKISFTQTSLLFLFLLGISLITTNRTNSYYAYTSAVISNTISTKNLFPKVSLYLSDDKRTCFFTANNISDYLKLSYKLTYDTDTVPQGLEGQVNLLGENELVRDITLGTCSSGGICLYQTGVKNFLLTIDLQHSDGYITSLHDNL